MKYINQTKMADKLENAYGAIYMWINLHNNHKYIGQAVTYRLQYREHEHAKAYDGCTLLNKAIKKYGHFNFLRIILDVAYSADELDEKEMYWIAKYNTYKGVGYNATKGGKITEGADAPACKGYILVSNHKTYELIGIYEGTGKLCATLKAVDGTDLKQPAISYVLNGKKGCTQHGGYFYMWVDASVYEAYLNGDNSLAIAKLDEHKQAVIKAKQQKEHDAYVKKASKKKYILVENNNKTVGVFTKQGEVANALGLNQSQISRLLKTGKPSQNGYTVKYITFEEYEALAN